MDIKIRDTVVNHTAGLSHSRNVAVNTIKKYLDADMSVLEISKLMHKPRFWVEEIIKINDLGSVSRINENNTEAKFYGFLRAGKSLREICAECNKSAGWVRGVIQKYNIDYPVEILYPKSKRTESIFTPNIIQRLTSMINKQTPLPEMSKDAELPKKWIYEWIRKTYGCTIGILYKKMNFAKEYYELAEKCREGAVLSDIYKTHHRTGIRRISEESLAVVKPDKMKLLDEKAPYMLQEGLPAEYIFNSLGVNEHNFYVWLNNRYGTNITGLQKKYHIKPRKLYTEKKRNLLIEAMAKFEHIYEIAEYMKLHKGTVLKLIKRYNLQSPMAKKQQKIAAELPDLYKKGLRIKEMAKYFEVSTATIKRRIKSLKSQGVLKD